MTVVCVYNDPVVRERCLDRSIEVLRDEAPDTEYIPVDNTGHAFPTAGAALNHGASRASNDYVVFVHQDVYLHSLVALETAAGILAGDSGFGVLGPFGFDANGAPAGHIRDRIVLIGEALREPREVDSLDEVLFMTSKDLVMREPLTQEPDMAWHAYAVEYGLRVRRHGLRPGVADIPLTHNSLTINLDRLDVAHRAVARAHPDLLPVHTTCGTVRAEDPAERKLLFPSQRWRYRWAKGSVAAHATRRAAGGSPVVLGDLRLDIDEVIAGLDVPLHIFNHDPAGTWTEGRPVPLPLMRRDQPVTFTSGSLQDLRTFIEGSPAGEPLLLTNLGTDDVKAVAPLFRARPTVAGLHDDFGTWVLVGSDLVTVPAHWAARPATPLGMPALVTT